MERQRWRPSRSVRARILLWVVLMAGLGLAVAGGTMHAIQSSRIDAAADLALRREYRVSGPYLTHLAMVGGEPFAYPGGPRPVALEDEPEALAAIRAVTPADGVVVTDVATSAGPVRLAVVPVTAGEAVGSYVIGHAVGLEKAALRELAGLWAILGTATLAVIAVVGWLVTGELVRPLARLRAATARTDARDLSARIPVTGEDEIAALTTNFNAMLDRLQEAFEAQRQLVDDVGHELRTPVTITRGYLELLDPGNPTAVADTRDLLLDETDRMGRLVGDLVTLAKSGRPDFVTPATVELEELTVEVFEKARALGDRHWVLDGAADVPLHADSHRLTEAWLQLVENAVAYSEPGSTIRIGSSAGGGEARLWVADRGRGIEAEHLDHVFDRFARAATDTEGSGLGLTIVRAIVEAHGGRVEVDSEPGVGSTFTLVLPAPHAEEVETWPAS